MISGSGHTKPKGAYTLNDWHVVPSTDSPYAAPETVGIKVVGVIQGHPMHRDGKRVRTGRVVDVQGRAVITASGSTYRLGRVSGHYRKWLRAQGRQYDPKQPIRLL